MKCKVARQQEEKDRARRRATRKVRSGMFKRFGPVIPCAYCGDLLTRLTATGDHVIPVSKGGTNKRGNIVLACSHCNSRKGSLDVREFKRSIGRQ